MRLQFGDKLIWRNGLLEIIPKRTVTLGDKKTPDRPPHGKRGSYPTPAMLAEMAYRAHDPCAYCGQPSEHWDHMHSRHRGGYNEPDNLTRACKRCNVNKRTLSPIHYLALRAAGLRQ